MNVTHINTVVCNSALLANYVNTTDAASLDELSMTLCELSDPEIIDLVATIHSELDAKSILLEFEEEHKKHAVQTLEYEESPLWYSDGVKFSSRLSNAHMEIPMETIFKDWQEINDYFVEVLGTDEATMLSLKYSTFIVPEVKEKQAYRQFNVE